jgi:hypothetical protein
LTTKFRGAIQLTAVLALIFNPLMPLVFFLLEL